MEIFGTIILWVFGLFILYLVIYLAVKDAIDNSVVGQLIKNKYSSKEKIVPISDEAIEKELEDFNK